MGILNHDEILELHAAILSARLVESRAALLAGLDAAFVAGLPREAIPSDQILRDLDALNTTGELADGTVPFAVWLKNAAVLAGPRIEAHIFRRAVGRLRELPHREVVAQEVEDWDSAHLALMEAAGRWLTQVGSVAKDREAKEAAQALYYAGVVVKTSRALDDRFRWIVAQVAQLRPDSSQVVRAQLAEMVKDIAHGEDFLSRLGTSLAGLEEALPSFDDPIRDRVQPLIDSGKKVLEMLGDSDYTPFNLKQDLTQILNGLYQANNPDWVDSTIQKCEECFTVIQRKALREADHALGRLRTVLLNRYDLPAPDWLIGVSREPDAPPQVGKDSPNQFNITINNSTVGAVAVGDQARAEGNVIQGTGRLPPQTLGQGMGLVGDSQYLSAAQAVALLKNYILDPLHRIRLEDLIRQETARLHDNLLPLGPPGVMERAQALALVENYEALCMKLSTLLVVGCYYGGSEHVKIWRTTLERIVGIQKGYDGLGNYPALILWYSACLGAILAERYDTLRIVTTETQMPRMNGETIYITARLRARFVLESEKAGKVFELFPAHMAFSKRLAKMLREAAGEVIGDAKVYEQAFDRMEYFLALTYLDLEHDEIPSEGYPPTGRFTEAYRYNDRDVPTIGSIVAKEYKQFGETWPPLKAGMFRGSGRRFEALADCVDRHALRMDR